MNTGPRAAWKLPWDEREFEVAYPFTETYPDYDKPTAYCSSCGIAAQWFPVEVLVQTKHHWNGDITIRTRCPEHMNGKEWQEGDPTRTGRNEELCLVHFIYHPVGVPCSECTD
jgi:hypothetical protein